MGIYPRINKRGGSNNHVVGRIFQKSISAEVQIRHVVGKILLKRIRKLHAYLRLQSRQELNVQ